MLAGYRNGASISTDFYRFIMVYHGIMVVDRFLQEVLFSVYVVEPGQSSEALISGLAAAARRGVRLRLRTDPWAGLLYHGRFNSSWLLLVC